MISLCDTGKPVTIPREAMTDLDLVRMLHTFFPEAQNSRDIEAFLSEYLTCDPDEITRRSRIIGKLYRNPEHKRLIRLLTDKWERLSVNLEKIARNPRPLAYCTYMLYTLDAYVSSVENAEIFFNAGDTPAVNRFISEEIGSDFFIAVKECLARIDKILQPLDNVTLAVNINESGYAARIGVTEINRNPEKRTGLFGGVRSGVNSLCDPAAIELRGPFSYLEEYLISQVEARRKPQISSALRAFKKIDINRLAAWRDWLKHIKLYRQGLRMMDRLAEAGFNVCAPQPSRGEFLAEGMIYPHLALEGKRPALQSFRFMRGETVLLTGANNAGKSSALKSAVQNSILAGLGWWVPASRFTFIPFSGYAAVFAAGEDSGLNASRFQLEAESMRGAVSAAGPGVCLLFNEPFTSTNPAEAAELLSGIVKDLRRRQATLLFVTHLFNVYKLLIRDGVTVRSYTVDRGTRSLEEREPDGLSYAKHLAMEYGFTIGDMVDDPNEAEALNNFLAGSLINA